MLLVTFEGWQHDNVIEFFQFQNTGINGFQTESYLDLVVKKFVFFF